MCAALWQMKHMGSQNMAIVEEGEYKGNALIVLKRTEEDRYPFQFGLSKAKLILEHIEDIRNWVKKKEAEQQSEPKE